MALTFASHAFVDSDGLVDVFLLFFPEREFLLSFLLFIDTFWERPPGLREDRKQKAKIAIEISMRLEILGSLVRTGADARRNTSKSTTNDLKRWKKRGIRIRNLAYHHQELAWSEGNVSESRDRWRTRTVDASSGSGSGLYLSVAPVRSRLGSAHFHTCVLSEFHVIQFPWKRNELLHAHKRWKASLVGRQIQDI